MSTPALISYSYDYQRVEAAVMELVPRWAACRFDGIVAIARGGLIPATMAATALDLPLHALSYDRKRRKAGWFSVQHPRARARLLLVEDIAGRGTTLVDCIEFLRAQDYSIAVFTLAYDAQSRVKPDYGTEMPPGRRAWFPWERESVTPEFGATENQPDKPLHRYASWAVDLDGVLLADLPLELYQKDLLATLAERDQLEPSRLLPNLDLRNTTIITGRPESDRERTQAWLSRHGFGGPLVMRDPARHAVQDTALHKADAIAARGHTHFIESDAVQAVDIARRLKVARIYWWNGSAAISISASADDRLAATGPCP